MRREKEKNSLVGQIKQTKGREDARCVFISHSSLVMNPKGFPIFQREREEVTASSPSSLYRSYFLYECLILDRVRLWSLSSRFVFPPSNYHQPEREKERGRTTLNSFITISNQLVK